MSQRWLQKIDEKFNDGNYYEAHQIHRTVYYRLLRENKFAEVYDLLFNGAVKLFEKKEFISGADLANLLVETLTKVDSPANLKRTDEEIINNLRLLFSNILPNSPERLQFVTKALTIPYLSTANIRKCFAEVLWKERNYPDSRLHFIYSSDNGTNCALMLIEYQMEAAYPGEVDLMIAQFVLQVLCIENQQLAFNTFHFYTLNHPEIKCTKPPFMTPLLNFISFLITAIEKYRGKRHVFDILCNIYEQSLNQDPCYKDYLIKIGQIYFGAEKKPTSSGLFSNLLQSLFDMPDSNEEETNSINYPSSDNTVSNRNQDVDLD